MDRHIEFYISLSSCLEALVSHTGLADQGRPGVFCQSADNVRGFMASRLLVSIENKDQLSPRIDPQLLIGSGRPYGRDKTTFHIRNTRAIQPVSLCAVLNGANQMYGIIMANDQEFFLSPVRAQTAPDHVLPPAHRPAAPLPSAPGSKPPRTFLVSARASRSDVLASAFTSRSRSPKISASLIPEIL